MKDIIKGCGNLHSKNEASVGGRMLLTTRDQPTDSSTLLQLMIVQHGRDIIASGGLDEM